MSLTRAYLKSLGLDEEKISSVIEAHSETVTALNGKYADLENKFNELNQRYETAKADAEKLPGVQKELEALRKEDYKGRYEALFSSVEKGKARAAKEAAVKAYYEGKNIRGGNLAIALRGTDLESLQLDGNGKLADTAALDALVEGDFKPLVHVGPDPPRRTVASGGSLASHGAQPDPTPSSVMNNLIRGKTN